MPRRSSTPAPQQIRSLQSNSSTRPRARSPAGRRKTKSAMAKFRPIPTPRNHVPRVRPTPAPRTRIRMPNVFADAPAADGECKVPEDFVLDTTHVLGKGSYGSVFPVHHKSDHTTPLVMKTVKMGVKAKQDAAVVREVAILHYLRGHPNVLQLACFMQKPGEMQIVMERCDGDLDGVEMEQTFLQSAIRQTVQGLAYVHAKGIIHFDVKPANLLFKGDLFNGGPNDFVIKVADFGLACSKTLSGALPIAACPEAYLAGTVSFFAPEMWQARSSALITTRAEFDACFAKLSFPVDVWAVGCVLLVLLKMDTDWLKATKMRLVRHYIEEQLPVRDPTPGIQEFVKATRTIDPAQRPSMAELLGMQYLLP